VGNHGYNLFIPNNDLNGFASTTIPFGVGILPATAPDSRVLQVTQFSNPGISNYNGLTVSLNQRVWRGFTGSVNYTWSHSLDDLSNGGLLPYSIYNSLTSQINPYCLRCQYASSDYDSRNNLNAQFVYNLPFKSSNGILNQLIGGWTMSETFFFRTGLPFTTFDGVTSGMLTGNNLGGATILSYPSGNGALPANCGAPAVSAGAIVPCLPASLFLPAGTEPGFNGIPRNYFRGPGYFNTDLTIRKTFKLTERISFQVAGIAYNVLNHPNFANPYPNMAVPSLFGSAFSTISPPTTPYGAFASAAEDARILQINAKIIF